MKGVSPGSAHGRPPGRSEEHTSELQSLRHLVCRLLLEKKKLACFDYPTTVGCSCERTCKDACATSSKWSSYPSRRFSRMTAKLSSSSTAILFTERTASR